MTRGCTQGFTLVELVVVMAIASMLAALMFGLSAQGQRVSMDAPTRVEMTTRGRAGVDAVGRLVAQAGAGADLVDDQPLAGHIPALWPRRLGLHGMDAFDVARGDLLTVVTVTGGPAQGVTTEAVGVQPSAVALANSAHCGPVGACGFGRGMSTLMFDADGHFDLFTATGVTGSTVLLERRGQSSTYPYEAGALFAEASTTTLYFDRVLQQVRQYDGKDTDVPLLDNVSDLHFDYFGEPAPPREPRPTLGHENCLYQSSGDTWGTLPVLTPEGGSLAPLPLSMLRDGPWCGDAAHRWDADLLRIRAVRVTLRVRGVARPGRPLRDDLWSFDVAPANLRGLK